MRGVKKTMSGIHAQPQQQQQQPSPTNGGGGGGAVVSVDKLWNIGITILLGVAFVVVFLIMARAISRYVSYKWNNYLNGRRSKNSDDEGGVEEEEDVEEKKKTKKKSKR